MKRIFTSKKKKENQIKSHLHYKVFELQFTDLKSTEMSSKINNTPTCAYIKVRRNRQTKIEFFYLSHEIFRHDSTMVEENRQTHKQSYIIYI